MDIFFLSKELRNSETLSEDQDEDQALFYVKDFGVETHASLFKALMVLEQNKRRKCLASNSRKELSWKTYNQHSPHPDTLFLITEVLD